MRKQRNETGPPLAHFIFTFILPISPQDVLEINQGVGSNTQARADAFIGHSAEYQAWLAKARPQRPNQHEIRVGIVSGSLTIGHPRYKMVHDALAYFDRNRFKVPCVFFFFFLHWVGVGRNNR